MMAKLVHPSDAELLELVLHPDPDHPVHAHLAQCEACRHRLEQVASVVAYLPDPPFQMSPSFDARLRSRLDAVDEARDRWRARWLWTAVPLATAAAAAVVLFTVSPASGPEGAEPVPLLADLDFYQDLDAVELVGVIDDLDAISALLEEDEG